MKEKYPKYVSKSYPVTAIARGGALAAVRNNVAGIATRLVPGLLSERQALQAKFAKENLPKARRAWNQAVRVFGGYGGSEQRLVKATLDGWKKQPVTMTGAAKGIDGKWYYYNPYIYSRGYLALHGDMFEDGYFSGVAGQSSSMDDAAMASGNMILSSIISETGKLGAALNPFTQAPAWFAKGAKNVVNLQPDATAPAITPDGKMVDKETQRLVDPDTGLTRDVVISSASGEVVQDNENIFGINKKIFWGASLTMAGLVIIYVLKK